MPDNEELMKRLQEVLEDPAVSSLPSADLEEGWLFFGHEGGINLEALAEEINLLYRPKLKRAWDQGASSWYSNISKPKNPYEEA